MANKNLNAAKTAKKDEFYTQYADIQKEINAYLDYDANVFRCVKGEVLWCCEHDRAKELNLLWY